MLEYKVTLKAARVNAGLTQTQVCDRLKMSKQTLVNYESGKTSPTAVRLMALLEMYDCPMDCIFLPNVPTESGGCGES